LKNTPLQVANKMEALGATKFWTLKQENNKVPKIQQSD
jgi:hypothetical protein